MMISPFQSGGHLRPSQHHRRWTQTLQLTWPIIRDHLEDVLTVTDEQIAVAMKRMWERLRLIVEPSGAVGLAAVYAHANQFTREDKVVIVITGGNVDLNKLPW